MAIGATMLSSHAAKARKLIKMPVGWPDAGRLGTMKSTLTRRTGIMQNLFVEPSQVHLDAASLSRT